MIPRQALPGLLAFVLTLVLAAGTGGCISIGTDDASDVPDSHPQMSPVATDDGPASELSILPIFSSGNRDNVLGSSVVLSSDGVLLTALEVLNGDIEIVLSDGTSYRPAIVSVEPEQGLVMLKIPVFDLSPIDISTVRPSVSSDVYATGYDAPTSEPGSVSGELTEVVEPTDDSTYRTRGPVEYQTDMHLPDGFAGGQLTDEQGALLGIITRGKDEGSIHAASGWFVTSWLESRERRTESLSAESAEWDSLELPGRWSISYPDGWSVSIPTESGDSFRAELIPGDPDVLLQMAISVEPNEYGTVIDEFVDEVFGERTSARVWTIDELQGRPFVRASIMQEGALVDVAYVLDDDLLIALSLTSGYQPESDPAQVDEARALFETVIESVERH